MAIGARELVDFLLPEQGQDYAAWARKRASEHEASRNRVSWQARKVGKVPLPALGRPKNSFGGVNKAHVPQLCPIKATPLWEHQRVLGLVVWSQKVFAYGVGSERGREFRRRKF